MRYCSDSCAVELSVEELCALAHKSGSIDARHPYRHAGGTKQVDQSRLQLPREEGRSAGVLLRNTVTHNGITYTVEGIADAVSKNGALIEEIKLTKGGGAGHSDLYSRLRCLAYFSAAAKDLRSVTLRMRIYNTETKEIKDICTEAKTDELYIFYASLLSRIEPLARELVYRAEERVPTVEHLRFPYPNPREGQSELAERVFRTVRRGERLFADAPTGIGKTMSTLYPSVKALGAGYCDRIFYLTAKASVRREAYSAAAKLYEQGARLRTVMLYAKEQMCAHPEGCRMGAASRCNPDACPFARGYYDRIDNAVHELLATHHGFPKALITEVAKRHRVCPYELSLDLSEYCEIIICDYNYAFSPEVYLRRYFDAEGERGKYVFLVDEAHNLPDRARDMFSARLALAPFEELYARIDPHEDGELEGLLGGFLMALHRLSELCTEGRVKNEDGTESGYYLNRAPLENLGKLATECRQKLEALVKKAPEHPLADGILELCTLLRHFCSLFEYYDERFLTFIELSAGALCVEIICLDPAGVLHSALGRAHAAVLFSATLKPLDYYVDLLGGGKGAQTLELSSPFDPEHLCVTVASGVSTRMEAREKSYRRIATLIAAAISAKAGNYMVYFPSYAYMERVLEQFELKYPKVPHVVQKRGMSHREQEEFLAYFKADEGKMRVGFCVLGGSFSEGVDLPGSRLIGVVVVGVGIPGLSNERNMLRDYYENTRERGFDYAYTYPGMNHVLQAAGRVIRREEDRGVVVLIDDRYTEEPYLHLYPSHWQGLCVAGDAASLAHRHKTFWNKEN